MYSYALAMAVIFISIIFYTFNNIRLNLKESVWSNKKELLRFSIPLLATSVMAIVLGWTDTLMLGRYATAEDVGVYNVSISLAKLLTFPLGAVSFVFMPIAAEMFSRKQHAELNRTYQILTKWIFSVTLPVFFILFFFPEMTITFLFGTRFVDASDSLRILSVCFLSHAFLGANGVILLVMGMSRIVMQVSIVSAFLNIVLNYVLIKQLGYGVNGASIATLVSYIALNTTTSVILYNYSKIHPITIKYIKPVIGSLIIGMLIYILAKSLPLHYWMLPLYLILFMGCYIVSLVITRSVDDEDILLFEAISKRTGLEMRPIRKILRRFAHYG
jgi:O-antigen/teichoic acid export membrane protein